MFLQMPEAYAYLGSVKMRGRKSSMELLEVTESSGK